MADIKLKKYRVPKTAITERGLRKLIRESMEAEGLSLTEWAGEHGVTPQAVSAFLCKRQTAGLKIPAIFGFVPQTIFLPEDEDPISILKTTRKSAKGKKDGKGDKKSKRGR